MDITLQANNYADGKANEAITKAIADAYMEGYKAGYKDREAEIPVDLRDDKTEYVDLGLPSHTLWAASFEKDENGNELSLPYCEAKRYKIPTKEQWEELVNCCEIYRRGGGICTIRGLNGQTLELPLYCDLYNSFWIESETDPEHKNLCAQIGKDEHGCFTGSKPDFTGNPKRILTVR